MPPLIHLKDSKSEQNGYQFEYNMYEYIFVNVIYCSLITL